MSFLSKFSLWVFSSVSLFFSLIPLGEAHDIVGILNVNTLLTASGNIFDMETRVSLAFNGTVTKENFLVSDQKYFDDNFTLAYKNTPCHLVVTDNKADPENPEKITLTIGRITCNEPITSIDDLYIRSTLLEDYGSPIWNNFIQVRIGDMKKDIAIDRSNFEFMGKNATWMHRLSSDEEFKKTLEEEIARDSSGSTQKDTSPAIDKQGEYKETLGFFWVMREFVWIWIEHILTGTDHILFVIALIMIVSSLSDILYLTSSFTLAHSITLILAWLGMLHVTSRIVEPMIAFSIVFMAIQNFLIFSGKIKNDGNVKKRLFITFWFGLFHGLGFAGSLMDISIPKDYFISSLLSFNIGVEIGQLIVISLAFPLILLMRKYIQQWGNRMLQVSSLSIACIAIFWCFERIFV